MVVCTKETNVCNAIWLPMVVYSEKYRYFCTMLKNRLLS